MNGGPFSGRRALVTGAAVRLGRAIALGLAERGADIALHYNSSADAAERTQAEIRALGRKCSLVPADLEPPDAAQKIMAAAGSALGRIDILVLSAAVFPEGRLADATPERFDRTLAVNLRAPFFLCREFARQTETGGIVFLADARVERPGRDHLVYSVAKSALIALTRDLAVSLAPGIRVNAVSPGVILPPPGKDESHLQPLLSRIPLGRPGTPEDIVAAVAYLLEAPYVTGEILRVSGGAYM
jgi:NAD(P)-dependent dehydrogenase (short-subunit alcohol dehydrogenase family)